MLGATDETETAGVIGEARLDRHEQRRQGGVPTVSVLAGPAHLAARLLARWCERQGRPLVLLRPETPTLEEVTAAWVDQLAAGCDLVEAAAAWLTMRCPDELGLPASSLRARTPVELALFLEGAVRFVAFGH